MTGELAGRRVLVTREHLGELAVLLADLGADVVHLPLIAVHDPDDDGAALRDELADLARYDWLIVTSPAGAERVAAAVRDQPNVRLAAVGTATAATLRSLGGRDVDLVPDVQHAEALADLFNDAAPPLQRVLIAQADRAAPTLAVRLAEAGHHVDTVIAYRTVTQHPGAGPSGDAVESADAVLFASGSAVESWFDALGTRTPPVVVAIGPSTAVTAERLGLKVTGVAADHSLEGLVTELVRQFA